MELEADFIKQLNNQILSASICLEKKQKKKL